MGQEHSGDGRSACLVGAHGRRPAARTPPPARRARGKVSASAIIRRALRAGSTARDGGGSRRHERDARRTSNGASIERRNKHARTPSSHSSTSARPWSTNGDRSIAATVADDDEPMTADERRELYDDLDPRGSRDLAPVPLPPTRRGRVRPGTVRLAVHEAGHYVAARAARAPGRRAREIGPVGRAGASASTAAAPSDVLRSSSLSRSAGRLAEPLYGEGRR